VAVYSVIKMTMTHRIDTVPAEAPDHMVLWWSTTRGIGVAEPAGPEVVASGQRSVGPEMTVTYHVVMPTDRT
jgi:hypothetical protein